MDNTISKPVYQINNRDKEDAQPKCPECGNHRLIFDEKTGDQICRNCGVVIKERIVDEGPEWRAFSPEEKNQRSRVGSPMSVLMHDKGLSTTIGWENRDIYGRRLNASKRAMMHRLRKWQRRTRLRHSQDRNLVQAFSELDRPVRDFKRG
jgi:transcription initiation factor TFIIB